MSLGLGVSASGASLSVSEKLTGSLLGWYAVSTTQALRADEIVYFSLFNEQLALFRDKSFEPKCIKDFCPHRGPSFRGGELIDGEIICPYHGARFGKDIDSQGQRITCQHIVDSSYDNYAKRIHLCQYPCIEKAGYIYVYYAGKARKDLDDFEPIPGLDHLLPETYGFQCSRYAYEEALLDFKCDWDRIIENHLDVLHIFWMHGKSLPGNDVNRDTLASFSQVFKKSRQSIQSKYAYKSDEGGEFITQIFVPPGRIFMFRGSPDKARYIQVLDHIPLAPNRARVIVRHYRSFLRNRFLSNLILFSHSQHRTFYRIFLEDYLVLQTQSFSQQMGYMSNRNLRLLSEDKMIQHFWDWHQRALSSEKPWTLHPVVENVNSVYSDIPMIYPPENQTMARCVERKLGLMVLFRFFVLVLIGLLIVCLI